MELQPTSIHYPPDDGYELCHGQLLGNKKFGFVQERKVFLFMISLNNYLFQLESHLAKPKIPSSLSLPSHASLLKQRQQPPITNHIYRDFCRELGSDPCNFFPPGGCGSEERGEALRVPQPPRPRAAPPRPRRPYRDSSGA